MRPSQLLALAVCMAFSTFAAAQPATRPAPLYDPDPSHLWNRLYEALWDRPTADRGILGHDRVDPLLWPETSYLLQGPSKDAAQSVLREFLNQHGEQLINDPLKRAMLLHDLWAIFDWAVNHYDELKLNGPPMDQDARNAQTALRDLLAEAIYRLLPETQEIDRLPDTYAMAVASGHFAPAYDPSQPLKPFLPPDLFDPNGPWVCVQGNDTLVPEHTRGFSRSVFEVFLNLRGGRQATIDYLKTLAEFKQPRVFQVEGVPSGFRFVLVPNPDLPQFPAGTQVALLRSAMLIDSRTQLHGTRLVETVQLRVYSGAAKENGFEFTLNRASLFAGVNGGLRPLDRDELDFFPIPLSRQMDEIEWQPGRDRRLAILNTCTGCHQGGRGDGPGGIFGFNTFLARNNAPNLNPQLYPIAPNERLHTGLSSKTSRYDWGLLQGLLIKSR